MLKICFGLTLVLVLLLPVALAQSIMGTLTGTVLDGSGAVAPNATVTLRNESSGDIRKTTGNAEGFFNFSSIPAASYSIFVELPGFSKWQRNGIVINANDKRNLTVTLSVGAAVTQVEVTASADALAVVDSGEKSALVTSAQLANLSIVGRNAAEYLKILPGSALTGNNAENRPAYTGETIGINGSGIGGNQGGMSGVKVNGQSLDITADGAHVMDPGNNGATPVNPNADMIQELKVLTSNFAAENAKGPVVVNSVSKSGGNAFHGEGYLYARNPVLNANDWENNHAGVGKPASEYYYPGGNIGGPVLIPGTNFNRNRDKLFFFQGFEYYKQTLDSGLMRAFVPTPEMLQGDFSRVNTYGRSGEMGNVPNFPGGVIPSDQIDPGGLILMKGFPAPNADPLANDGFNYVNTLAVKQNSYQSLSRVDYSVSDNTKLFVRLNLQKERQNQPMGLWANHGADWMVPSPSNIIGDNKSASLASSLTHVFTPTMTNELVFGYTLIDFPNYPEDPKKLQRSDLGYPYKGIFHEATTMPVLANWYGFPQLGAGGGFNPKFIATKYLWNVGDNMAKVVGTHTLKFGAYFEQVINKQNEWNVDNGLLAYAGWFARTGNPYADLLAGYAPLQAQENTVNPVDDMGYRILDFYAQDSWKATRRLTLEYGIRVQHLGAHYNRTGFGIPIFDSTRYSNDPADAAKMTGLYTYKTDKNVPLSGRSVSPFYYAPRFGFAYDIFGTGNTVLRGGFGHFRSQDGLAGYVKPATTSMGGKFFDCWGSCPTFLRDLDNVQVQTGGITGLDVADLNDHQMGLTTSYSFTLNQRLPGSLMFEAGYVGNSSSHQYATRNINAVPLGAALGTGDTDPQHFRPYKNYQGINVISHFLDSSKYNAFQTGLTRQAGAYMLSMNYTWSKLTGNRGLDSGLPDAGVKWRHGVLKESRPHVFNLAYSVKLPMFAKANPFAQAALNGWQISGITQIQSGADLALNALSNLNVAFDANNGVSGMQAIGTNDITLFPVMTCDPRSGLAHNQFINAACFGPVPTGGKLGDGAFPYIPGPMFMNHDLSLFKSIPISEHRKLEFRASAFNFLNHPLTSFRKDDDNLKLHFDANGNLTTPRFGYADYKFGHRVMQLAVKFLF